MLGCELIPNQIHISLQSFAATIKCYEHHHWIRCYAIRTIDIANGRISTICKWARTPVAYSCDIIWVSAKYARCNPTILTATKKKNNNSEFDIANIQIRNRDKSHNMQQKKFATGTTQKQKKEEEEETMNALFLFFLKFNL